VEHLKSIPLRRARSWLIYFRALLAPVSGAPRARVAIPGGLLFEAARGGVTLILPKERVPAWFIPARGQTLSKLVELSSNKQTVYFPWGAKLADDIDREHTLTLVKDRRIKR
jgi:hypothetical protein